MPDSAGYLCESRMVAGSSEGRYGGTRAAGAVRTDPHPALLGIIMWLPGLPTAGDDVSGTPGRQLVAFTVDRTSPGLRPALPPLLIKTVGRPNIT